MVNRGGTMGNFPPTMSHREDERGGNILVNAAGWKLGQARAATEN